VVSIMSEISSQKKHFPLVSIVTPTYNQAEYLAETIESVLSQTYSNIEYIVIDDGSTDNTQEVLSRFDSRIRHERHSNVGQAKTLNRGWAMSSGSLLGYLSSDDRLVPDAVARLVEGLSQHMEAAVVYCDYDLIDAKGRRFRSVKAGDFSISRLTVDLVCQPGPGALFRREVFERSGGWNESLRQVPDFEFWLRASRFGYFIRVPEILAHYRIHEESASFRPISAERSMEVVRVMTGYWDGVDSPEASRSMATAKMHSGKSHLQSGRLIDGLKQFYDAFCRDPSILLNGMTWRMMISGLFRRMLYFVNKRDR
jgi:glycosyltransferase involved in cell wall biosynthesis